MLSTPKKLWSVLLVIVMMTGFVIAQDVDDEDDSMPDARVARISVLEGKAQIKRVDAEEWEEVVLNLPIVEGDTIQTDAASKLEIQLDDYTYVRLDENTALKFKVLADEGVAISVPTGLIGLSVIQFDIDKSYFEIDAPSSTITIQKKGTYRISAGDELSKEVRVSVRDDGAARVYSNDSGFTLKEGNVAVLALDGSYAGQWETSRSSKRFDAFDFWLQDRDEVIAKNFADRDVQYVDQDVYGDDDLADNGDWINTADYGNVWRPSRRATSRYSNWSPYRYGEWRWLPYYGWTWVNDEPWGWATYHSGNWIFYRGGWVWSPQRAAYGRYGWWRPAIVFVSYVRGSYCWYPLPYGYSYYDYNRRFRNRWNRKTRRNGRHGNNGNGNGNSPNTPTSIPSAPQIGRGTKNTRPPLASVPPGAIVSTPAGQFGRGRTKQGYDNPSLNVAQQVLRKSPTIANSPPFVPSYDDNDRKTNRTTKAPVRTYKTTTTGAAPRTTAAPLDQTLRRTRINGNRVPLTTMPRVVTPRTTKGSSNTGVFVRTKRPPVADTPPIRSEQPTRKTTQRTTRSNDRKTSPPVRRSAPPQRSTQSIPERREPTRSAPTRSAPTRSAPTRSAPTRSAPTRSAPTRSAPTKKDPPRSAPKKSAPAPSKSGSTTKKKPSSLN